MNRTFALLGLGVFECTRWSSLNNFKTNKYMGWAIQYIKRLREGETVQFRPHGGSMKGLIESGQLVTVVPFDGDVKVSDIVLCRVKGQEFLHLVTQVDVQIQISNNKGKVNGWIKPDAIYGKCIKVVD